MVLIDTSAWIEYFQGGAPAVVRKVATCLREEDVAIGDLIYCEIMQGLHVESHRRQIDGLLTGLPRFKMVGFEMAAKSAANYRFLRGKGVTVRKTIDVLIGTFCAENDLPLLHHDRDFDLMAGHIGLKIR